MNYLLNFFVLYKLIMVCLCCHAIRMICELSYDYIGGIDGFIFKPKDVDVLSEKIKWVWNNRTKEKEMGMQGRTKVEENFNAKTHCLRLMEIYQSGL